MLRVWRGIALERLSLDLLSLLQDGFIVEDSSAEERIKVFVELNSLFEEKLLALSPEERGQLLRAADESGPRPDPWWRNFRAEALAEYGAAIEA